MRILFNNADGKIYYAVPDRDWFMFHHSTQISLTEFEIDEVAPNNQTACHELYHGYGTTRVDAAGDPKYFMFDNAGTWELHEKADWVEEPGIP